MSENFESGKVVEIKLENGKFGYGLVIDDPLVAFSELTFDKRPSDFEQLFRGSSFMIWVMRNALGKSGWTKVCTIELGNVGLTRPRFYKFDLISKQFSIYFDGKEEPAVQDDCLNLECAAVWSREHVEERLLAISEGRECVWTRSLSAKNRI